VKANDPQNRPGHLCVPRGAIDSRKFVHEVESLLSVGTLERSYDRSKTRVDL
jgi:hypothetical protein